MEVEKKVEDLEEKKKNRMASILRLNNLVKRECMGLKNVECVCAYFFAPDELIRCPNDHLFCKDCIKTNTELSFAKNIPRWECLDGDCGKEFPDEELRKVFSAQRIQEMYKQRSGHEYRIAVKDALKQCPECRWACRLDDKTMSVFPCQKCRKTWCTICWGTSHGKEEECPVVKLAREERQDSAAGLQRFVAAAMDNLLIRACPHCGTRSVHDAGDGCNFIYCNCKKNFCYYCGQAVTEADHNRTTKHYITATNPVGCNLFGGIDQKKRDEVRNKAIQEWKDQHPKYADLEVKV